MKSYQIAAICKSRRKYFYLYLAQRVSFFGFFFFKAFMFFDQNKKQNGEHKPSQVRDF